MKIAALTFLLLYCCTSLAITGGKTVSPSDPIAKHLAYLEMYGANGQPYNCTSVIIAKNMLLTAAHCAKFYAPWRMWAAFTTQVQKYNQNWASAEYKKGNLIPVKTYAVNKAYVVYESPSYNFKTETTKQYDKIADQYFANYVRHAADLAVVVLTKNIPPGFQPVPIYQGQISDNTILTISGYGLNSVQDYLGGAGNTFTLRKVRMKINQINKNTFGSNGVSQTDSVCSGDSGGAAFIRQNGKLYLVGTTILGSCGKNREQNIFEHDKTFKNWILNQAPAQAQKFLAKITS